MSVTLWLEGERERSDPRALLDAVRAWLEARGDDPAPVIEVAEDQPLLVAELHPGAEPIEIAARPEGLSLRAKTNTAGPGYHRHVCALARALAEELGVSWTAARPGGEAADELGYFEGGDDAALDARFLEMLHGAAEHMLEAADEGATGFAFLLPEGHVFEHRGVLASPLGPRDAAWLRAAVADPSVAIDVVPCWHDVGTAEYFRRLALTRMWIDVRWRAPVDDAERARLEQIATWVERAHGLDSSLALPWAEQAEIFGYLSEESLRATRAQLKAQSVGTATVGYRRRPVRVSLTGGWRMTVPGELAERWEERGTWVGWDGERTLWFSSLTVFDDDGEEMPDAESTLAALPPLSGEERMGFERGDVRGAASFVSEEHEGERLFRLEAHAASGHHAAVGTFVFVSEAERAWALETWGTLSRG